MRVRFPPPPPIFSSYERVLSNQIEEASQFVQGLIAQVKL
jgi:hypothetical protein